LVFLLAAATGLTGWLLLHFWPACGHKHMLFVVFACLTGTQLTGLIVFCLLAGRTVWPPPAVTGSAGVFYFGHYRPPQRIIIVFCCGCYRLNWLIVALFLSSLQPWAQVDCCSPTCGRLLFSLLNPPPDLQLFSSYRRNRPQRSQFWLFSPSIAAMTGHCAEDCVFSCL